MSGDLGRYILELERSVENFDIGSICSSPKLRCKTWHKVVYRLCHFSRLRRTLRGLNLVSCRNFSGQGSGYLRYFRRPHAQRDLVFNRCMSLARLVGKGLRYLGLCRERVDMGRGDFWKIHS